MTRRVLHLIDPANPAVGECVSALAADAVNRSDQLTETVLLIGATEAERIAKRVGLPLINRIAPPAGNGTLGFTAIRRFIARDGAPDIAFAWSLSTLTAAVFATRSRVPLVLMLTLDPATPAEAHWLRMLTAHRAINMLAISHSVKRAWVQGGVPAENVHVLRPGIDFSRLKQADREEVRQSWGVKRDETMVIAALGHPAHRMNTARAAHIVGMARLIGLEAVLIVPDAGERIDTAEYHTRIFGSTDKLFVDSRLNEPWRVLPGVDIALMLGDDTKDPPSPPTLAPWHLLRRPSHRNRDHGVMSGILPLLWAAASGKNIVAEASYAVSEIIENNHSGALVKPGDTSGLVRRLGEVRSNPERAWKNRDTARSEAYSIFSRQRFATDLATVVEQILTPEPVRIPDLRITGGLRFESRA